jgi:hypothetical protein
LTETAFLVPLCLGLLVLALVPCDFVAVVADEAGMLVAVDKDESGKAEGVPLSLLRRFLEGALIAPVVVDGRVGSIVVLEAAVVGTGKDMVLLQLLCCIRNSI